MFDKDQTQVDFVGKNLARAIELGPNEWRTWHARSQYLFNKQLFVQGYSHNAEAYRKFRQNPIISMDYARSLLNTGRFAECLAVLRTTLVLPQEGAQEGHEIYELANLSLALQMMDKKKFKQSLSYINEARKWPENLGSGSPYNPDTRLHDYMAAFSEMNLGN